MQSGLIKSTPYIVLVAKMTIMNNSTSVFGTGWNSILDAQDSQ